MKQIFTKVCLSLVAFAVLYFLLVSTTKAQTVGIHIASHHWTDSKLNDFNPGAYYRFGNGAQVGTYYNSYNRQSFYAGWHFETEVVAGWTAGLSVGGVTGYRKDELAVNVGGISPMVVPSVATPKFGGWRLRLQGVPKIGSMSSAVLHFSVEHDLGK